MTKTSTEVCTEAFRMIGVASVDEDAQPTDIVRAQAHMADIFATLNDTQGLAFDWTIETVPDGAFLAFARAVAGSVATTYTKPEFAAFYDVGVRQLREFAGPDLDHDNDVVQADYF